MRLTRKCQMKITSKLKPKLLESGFACGFREHHKAVNEGKDLPIAQIYFHPGL